MKLINGLLLATVLFSGQVMAENSNAKTAVGGGLGAAAGTVLGGVVGGSTGEIIGGAVGGGVGGAVTTKVKARLVPSLAVRRVALLALQLGVV